MATFVTDAALREQVTAENSMRSEPLPGHWDALIPRANLRAYTRLRAVCFGRGMTAAEFAQFGAGEESDGYDWNLRLGVLFAFLGASRTSEDKGAAYAEEARGLLEELQTADLVIGDDIWAPQPGRGRVTFGPSDTSGDRFLLDDPDGDGSWGRDEGTRL